MPTETRTAPRSLRLLFSMFLALGVATGVSVFVQQSAQAATSASVKPMSSIANCPSGDLCWWVDANQVGVMHPVRDAIYDWSTQSEPSCPNLNWNDCASTLYNNKAGFGAQVYANAYPKGGSPSSSDPGYCLEPGSHAALDLATVHYSNEESLSLNDTISANQWRTGGC